MTPISAIRSSLTPEALTSQLPPAVQTALEGKEIPFDGMQQITPGARTPSILETQPTAGGDFSNFLGRMVSEVNAKQTAASDAVHGMMSGENISLHQAMVAMEEASVSFQLMVEVRNKLLESYQELMRMQV